MSTNFRHKNIVILYSLFVIFASGCAITEKAFHMFAVSASYFKSPVVIATDKINEGLDVEDCQALKEVSFQVRKGEERHEAVMSLTSKERIDTFDDLNKKETMVFICLSGGGSRASALAMHSLSLLEKTYNRMRNEIPENSDMHELIDGYSTVSGGSVYASVLALNYMRNSFLLTEEQVQPSFINAVQKAQKPLSQYLQSKFSSKLQNLLRQNNQPRVLKSILVQEMNNLLKTSFYDKQKFPQLKMSTKTTEFLTDKQKLIVFNRLLLEDAYPEGITKIASEIVSKNHSVFFQDLVHSLQEYAILTPHGPLRSLGATSALAYFFTAGGLPFLSTIFTDFTYLDILAAALNVHHGNYFYTTRHELGDLPKIPRFFFNSTCLETGMPFVFTQSMMHLPEETDFFQDKPLKHALTLENIYSSPRKFPLNYAAMASAAFPVFTPMSLRKYKYEDSRSINDKTSDILSVADGGLYDNSGITSVSDLVEYVATHSKEKKRVVLVYVDAGIEDYHYSIAQKTSDRSSSIPLKLQSPILNPVIEGMARGADVMHFINKQRAVKLALESFKKLEKDEEVFNFYNQKTIERLDRGILSEELLRKFIEFNKPLSENVQITIMDLGNEWRIEDKTNKHEYILKANENNLQVYRPAALKEVVYFPISTAQLAGFSDNSLPGQDELFRKVQAISTDFVISAEQENLLADVAEVLVTANQQESGYGWKVGPRKHLFFIDKRELPQEISSLQDFFRNSGYALSQKNVIVETAIESKKWRIKDIPQNKEYLAILENGVIGIYSPMKTIYHIDIAFSYALMRAQQENWDEFLESKN